MKLKKGLMASQDILESNKANLVAYLGKKMLEDDKNMKGYKEFSQQTKQVNT